MKRGGSQPPNRRVNTAGDSRPNLLIFSEGKVTEVQYINDWYKRHRELVTVQFDEFHGTPYELVKHAVDAKKRETREEKRGRGRAHSHYWCIFDRDEHPYISDTFSLAEKHGIHTAYTNPCIELWFLLHFQEQTASLHRHTAQRIAKRYLNCDKSLTPRSLSLLAEEERFSKAKKRALKLDVKHDGDKSPPASNPSSGVWKLMELIKVGQVKD